MRYAVIILGILLATLVVLAAIGGSFTSDRPKPHADGPDPDGSPETDPGGLAPPTEVKDHLVKTLDRILRQLATGEATLDDEEELLLVLEERLEDESIRTTSEHRGQVAKSLMSTIRTEVERAGGGRGERRTLTPLQRNAMRGLARGLAARCRLRLHVANPSRGQHTGTETRLAIDADVPVPYRKIFRI